MKSFILPLALFCLGCSSEALSDQMPETITGEIEQLSCDTEIVLNTVMLTLADLSFNEDKYEQFLAMPIDNIKTGPYNLDENIQACSAIIANEYPVDYFIQGGDDVYTVMDAEIYEKFIGYFNPIESIDFNIT